MSSTTDLARDADPRFAAVADGLKPFVDRGDLSGVVTLTWKDGAVRSVNVLGQRDMETGAPMQRDTLFRIASMTKPVTTAAAMILIEQGKMRLDDPITRWAPEFANVQVLKDPAGPLDQTEPAKRVITIEDLMTHRSGLAYGFSSRGPIGKAHDDVLGSPLFSRMTPDQWMAALASLPLTYHPGERMHYSHATEVLGFIVARAFGSDLATVLKEQIFAPLGMHDTDFWMPQEKRDRMAVLYGFEEAEGKLKRVEMPMGDKPSPYAAGGGGLISTADDYLRFARLMLNGGEVDGVRLLKAETVADMRTNRLTDAQRQDLFLGMPMWIGMGFGLGLSVVDAPEKNMLGAGPAGCFGWPGAFGTWWHGDPVNNMIMIYLIQHSIPLNADAGAQIAGGRGLAGRLALPQYQRLTYEGLKG